MLANKLLSLVYRILHCIYIKMQLADMRFNKNLQMGGGKINVLGKVYMNATQVKFGKNVTLYPGCYFWGRNIEIGDNVDIGIGTIIYSRNGVKIGSNTSIAAQCYIIDSNHGMARDTLIREQPMNTAENGIEIGEDVWIAAQCMVLKGAKINNHAVVGAQSLVNSEIPENAIAIGTPARVKSYRR